MILEPVELTSSGRPNLHAKEVELLIYDKVSQMSSFNMLVLACDMSRCHA